MPRAVSVVTDGTDCQRAVWCPPWRHHPLVAPPKRSPGILRKEEAFSQVNISVPGQNKPFFLRIAFTLLSELLSLLYLPVYNCFHIFTLLFIFYCHWLLTLVLHIYTENK